MISLIFDTVLIILRNLNCRYCDLYKKNINHTILCDVLNNIPHSALIRAPDI